MQGMHELLAVVVMALVRDIAAAHPESDRLGEYDGITQKARPEALDQDPGTQQGAQKGVLGQKKIEVQPGWAVCVSAEHLEADAFTIFSSLMNYALPFYSDGSTSKGTAAHAEPFMYNRVQHIHFALLQRYDPELFQHLEEAQVLPHLYLIQWLRLLFIREFTIDQSFLIWDTILQSKGLELVDYVCVAMLSFIRDDLLSLDTATCLTKIFHYPELDNGQVSEVLSLAQALFDGTVFNFSKRPMQVPKILTSVTSSFSKLMGKGQ